MKNVWQCLKRNKVKSEQKSNENQRIEVDQGRGKATRLQVQYCVKYAEIHLNSSICNIGPLKPSGSRSQICLLLN